MNNAPVAQWLEQSAYIRLVGGSNPSGSTKQCGCNSVVECQPSKLFVAGSIPVARSNLGVV